MQKTLFILITLFSFSALAAGGPNAAKKPQQMQWEFEGIFGRFDRASIQRGYQVYKEVCSSCHGLDLVAFRNLEEIGFSADEVKAIAAGNTVVDGPDDQGDMFDRPGIPSDKFVNPFDNENAARASNGGAYPPDLSLMVKARPDGANYIYSLLMGYADAPDEFELASGKSYNPYFEGRQISMPAPINDDGQVEYMDGTFATQEQMAIDITNFLQWSAEPEMEQRKKMGVRSLIFLSILLILLIAAKRAVWKNVK